MSTRRMIFGPRGWYPAQRGRCEAMIAAFTHDRPRAERLPEPIVAAIVPHAGWRFSGRTAWAAIAALPDADVVVLFGNDHGGRARRPALIAEGAWETPFGEVQVDAEFAGRLLEAKVAAMDERAHQEEHSIEIQMPLVAKRFPDARVVPILVPHTDDAKRLGETAARLAGEGGRRVVVIGTTDLTHYGDNYGFAPAGDGPAALPWMKKNDASIIEVMRRLAVDEVYAEVEAKGNACGAGPIVATLAYAKARGSAGGVAVHYTTSADESPDRGGPFLAVGYVGMLF
ncbi:MAG: AmmeMemoRadiSam system protein B [Planctomycetota bacterium]